MSEVLPVPDDLGNVTVVIAGGTGPTRGHYDAIIGSLDGSARVVAADSGADHARALGLHVDTAVGDFDSASDSTLTWLRQRGSDIRQFGAHKDHSDLELGLFAASEGKPEAIIVLGLGGGRPDHSMLNLLVLADESWSGSRVFGLAGDCWISVIHDHTVLKGQPDSLVSLVPVGGPATVTTDGLLYELNREELCPTRARGLSNVVVRSPIVVDVAVGTLLAMQPTGGG